MPTQKIKLIQQGAEAKILLDENKKQIIKDRTPKSYRIKELDDKIRRMRTKSEIKLLIKASKIISTPLPILTNNSKEKEVITMPYIKGKKLSQYLDSFPLTTQKTILKQIGKDIALLHKSDIIHGDLTTSNMILTDNSPPHQPLHNKNYIKESNKQTIKNFKLPLTTPNKSTNNNEPIIHLIDFGLGFFNGKFEDKAVDIHLFKQALEAKHFKNWQVLFNEFLKGYESYNSSKTVLERLKAVEKRGRYKH